MPDPGPRPVPLGAAVDPDVDLHVPSGRREWSSHRWVLPVIAVGGMVGATARFLLSTAYPTAPGSVPWATFTINATGCLLIGVLMVFVVEVGGTHPLLRPFLGVGVLGGYTTFSTASYETVRLAQQRRYRAAAFNAFGMMLLALAAAGLGLWLGAL